MLLTAIVMLCSSIVNITAFAYTVPETIHIGLSNIGSAITLSNKSINVGAEENGTYVSGGTIKSEKGFTFSAGSGTYGAVSLYYDNYESAKQNAATIANALPAYTGGGKWQIYVSGMTGEQVRQKTGLPAENVSSVSNMILVQSGGKTMFITNMITPQFGAADNDTGVITINNKEYRGKIQPTRVNGGSIIPVNAVSIEEYLYGVVPSEMSPSYAGEALKAQAVAARTYAIKKMDMKVHENKGYDLCDGTHCQSYKGKSAEFPATNAAVDATKGLVIYHKGEPIEAVFFASSGGYTENSEDIWTAPLPYLKAVPDVYEVDTNTWTKKITAAQLTNLASAKGDNIGQVTDMVISKVSLGGRIQELKLVGTKGTKVLTRDQVRTYFSSLNGSFPSKMFTINGKGGGPKTTVSMNTRQLSDISDAANVTNSPEESIADNYVIGSDSLLFPELETYNTTPTNVSNNVTSAVMQRNVTVTGASSGAVSTNNGTGVFVIEGKGNGHGAGLSQKGAQGLALPQASPPSGTFLKVLHSFSLLNNLSEPYSVIPLIAAVRPPFFPFPLGLGCRLTVSVHY